MPNKASSITPYTKADIRNGYFIPRESPVYRKIEKYKLFRIQNWFIAVHPNAQVDAKLEYLVSRVLLEMDHTSLSINKKQCNLDRDLKQTAVILLTQRFPPVGYVITGQRHIFATLKSTRIISFFQFKSVASSLYVLENQSFERIPLFYQKQTSVCTPSHT